MGLEEHDDEGRLITLEFDSFYFATVYVPNSKRELERLDYRMKWEDDFRSYILALNKSKPIVFCGDLNVAHKEIDLKNPKTNHNNAGFTDDERKSLVHCLKAALPIHSDIFIPIQRVLTVGGPICSGQEKKCRLEN